MSFFFTELTSKALEEEDNPNRGRLIQMEERQTGSIPWKTYFNFLAKAGVFSVALTIITNVVVLFTGVFGQYWISLWSQSGQDAIDEGVRTTLISSAILMLLLAKLVAWLTSTFLSLSYIFKRN